MCDADLVGSTSPTATSVLYHKTKKAPAGARAFFVTIDFSTEKEEIIYTYIIQEIHP